MANPTTYDAYINSDQRVVILPAEKKINSEFVPYRSLLDCVNYTNEVVPDKINVDPDDTSLASTVSFIKSSGPPSSYKNINTIIASLVQGQYTRERLIDIGGLLQAIVDDDFIVHLETGAITLKPHNGNGNSEGIISLVKEMLNAFSVGLDKKYLKVTSARVWFQSTMLNQIFGKEFVQFENTPLVKTVSGNEQPERNVPVGILGSWLSSINIVKLLLSRNYDKHPLIKLLAGIHGFNRGSQLMSRPTTYTPGLDGTIGVSYSVLPPVKATVDGKLYVGYSATPECTNVVLKMLANFYLHNYQDDIDSDDDDNEIGLSDIDIDDI